MKEQKPKGRPKKSKSIEVQQYEAHKAIMNNIDNLYSQTVTLAFRLAKLKFKTRIHTMIHAMTLLGMLIIYILYQSSK